ncbi:MAG TPA: hypothetical protein VE732_07705 [Nitrososphaera sp.]|nr:hypothetical protein [Nitrososphaera sp.]
MQADEQEFVISQCVISMHLLRQGKNLRDCNVSIKYAGITHDDDDVKAYSCTRYPIEQ